MQKKFQVIIISRQKEHLHVNSSSFRLCFHHRNAVDSAHNSDVLIKLLTFWCKVQMLVDQVRIVLGLIVLSFNQSLQEQRAAVELPRQNQHGSGQFEELKEALSALIVKKAGCAAVIMIENWGWSKRINDSLELLVQIEELLMHPLRVHLPHWLGHTRFAQILLFYQFFD